MCAYMLKTKDRILPRLSLLLPSERAREQSLSNASTCTPQTWWLSALERNQIDSNHHDLQKRTEEDISSVACERHCISSVCRKRTQVRYGLLWASTKFSTSAKYSLLFPFLLTFLVFFDLSCKRQSSFLSMNVCTECSAKIQSERNFGFCSY